MRSQKRPVLLRLQRAVVDRLRLGDLAEAPGPDLLGGGETDLDCVEVVDVDHVSFTFCACALVAVLMRSVGAASLRLRLLRLGVGFPPAPLRRLGLARGLVGRLAAVGADAREVDAQLLGSAQQVVLLLRDPDVASPRRRR